MEPGILLRTFSSIIEIWWTFGSHPSFDTVIATKFCTWHDSCAAMACVKFVLIWTPRMELYLIEFEFWVKNSKQHSYNSAGGLLIPCEIFIVNDIGHATIDKGDRKLWNKLTLFTLNCLEKNMFLYFVIPWHINILCSVSEMHSHRRLEHLISQSQYMAADGLVMQGARLLTHLPLDKMATISQTIFLDVFSCMKRFVFWLQFHWSLFLRVQFTITQHWFR